MEMFTHLHGYCCFEPGNLGTLLTSLPRLKANATEMAEKAEKKASEADQEHLFFPRDLAKPVSR